MESKTYIEVCQIRSLIGRPQSQRVLVRSLGLRRIGHKAFLPDTPAVRGIVEKAQHLLRVYVRSGEVPNVVQQTVSKRHGA
ncbi:MAG: 50S ribosomal protein L30 [Myxococcota bacterium]